MARKVIFKDIVDKQLEDRVQDIVNKKLTEREEQEKKKTVADKLSAIKHTLIVPREIPKEIPKSEAEHVHTHVPEKPEKVEDGNDCPTCGTKNKHTIKITGKVAKCTSPDCGNEYLLEQKIKNPEKSKRKDLLCTTCGHSMNEEELKGKETCPLCGIGKGVMKVNWGDYDSGKLSKTRVI